MLRTYLRVRGGGGGTNEGPRGHDGPSTARRLDVLRANGPAGKVPCDVHTPPPPSKAAATLCCWACALDGAEVWRIVAVWMENQKRNPPRVPQ